MYRFEPGYFMKLASADIVAMGAPDIARRIWSYGKRGWQVFGGNAPDEHEKAVAERRLQKGMERRNIAYDPNVGGFVPRQQVVA